jgi:hypothetical protein
MRGRMSDARSYATPVAVGDVMCGHTVSEVVDSRNPDFSKGEFVTGYDGWQAYGLIGGPPWLATLLLGAAMLVFDFGAILYGINYLSLRQAITPDRLLGRMTATMRFFTVASAPLGSLVGGALASEIGLRSTLLAVGMLGLLLSAAAVVWSPVRGHRTLPRPLTD